jgi:hypothetical protein
MRQFVTRNRAKHLTMTCLGSLEPYLREAILTDLRRRQLGRAVAGHGNQWAEPGFI